MKNYGVIGEAPDRWLNKNVPCLLLAQQGRRISSARLVQESDLEDLRLNVCLGSALHGPSDGFGSGSIHVKLQQP